MFIKTIEKLDKFIRLHNPYYAAYKQMRQLEIELELESKRLNIPVKHISMFFKTCSSDDPKRYNVPKIGEIAAVFCGEDGAPTTSDLRVYPKNENNHEFSLNKINILSELCDPMVYPLFFLNGEPGWRPGITHDLIKE